MALIYACMWIESFTGGHGKMGMRAGLVLGLISWAWAICIPNLNGASCGCIGINEFVRQNGTTLFPTVNVTDFDICTYMACRSCAPSGDPNEGQCMIPESPSVITGRPCANPCIIATGVAGVCQVSSFFYSTKKNAYAFF